MKTQPVDPKLLALLCCPKCRGDLNLRELLMVCLPCAATWPIKRGVPLLVPEEERRLRS